MGVSKMGDPTKSTLNSRILILILRTPKYGTPNFRKPADPSFTSNWRSLLWSFPLGIRRRCRAHVRSHEELWWWVGRVALQGFRAYRA